MILFLPQLSPTRREIFYLRDKKIEFYSMIDIFLNFHGVDRTLWPSVMGLSALAYELLEVSEPKVNDLSADQRSVN